MRTSTRPDSRTSTTTTTGFAPSGIQRSTSATASTAWRADRPVQVAAARATQPSPYLYQQRQLRPPSSAASDSNPDPQDVDTEGPLPREKSGDEGESFVRVCITSFVDSELTWCSCRGCTSRSKPNSLPKFPTHKFYSDDPRDLFHSYDPTDDTAGPAKVANEPAEQDAPGSEEEMHASDDNHLGAYYDLLPCALFLNPGLFQAMLFVCVWWGGAAHMTSTTRVTTSDAGEDPNTHQDREPSFTMPCA